MTILQCLHCCVSDYDHDNVVCHRVSIEVTPVRNFCAAFACGGLPVRSAGYFCRVSSARRRIKASPSVHSRARIFAKVATEDRTKPAVVHVDDRPAGDEGVPDADDSNREEEQPVDRLQATIDSATAFVSAGFDKIVDPFVQNCSLLQGRWERNGGAYILRPRGRAKAVIHFIGGAFFGCAPHIFYRTFLELLAARGFCIVASSYELRLDYLATTAEIVAQWEAVETDLALDYGAIPVIGVGHSAGSVFHCIASSLFDDMNPKAGNVLISFNNKVLREAIPLYSSAVLPIVKQTVAVEEALPDSFLEAIESLPGTIDAAIEGSLITPTRFKKLFLPVIQEARGVVEQLRPLVRELGGVPRRKETLQEGEGQDSRVLDEFYPPPSDIAAAISKMYGVPQTLIVRFSDDNLDESETLLSHIRLRGDDSVVSMMELEGSHITPLTQDLTIPSTEPSDQKSNRALDLAGLIQMVLRETAAAFGMREVGKLVVLIDEWVDAGIANDTL
jgi:acetyl esterase/lipase